MVEGGVCTWSFVGDIDSFDLLLGFCLINYTPFFSHVCFVAFGSFKAALELRGRG